MRTKALLCAAGLLAAGVANLMAQGNVYSLNVVGYVNATITNGSGAISGTRLTLVNTPLTRPELAGNYAITNIADPGGTNLPNGTRIYTFAGGLFFTTTKSGGVWGAPNTQLPNGNGYFILNAQVTNLTVTYVGEVPQGSLSNNLPSGILALRGSQVPRSGFIQDLGITSFNGDRVYRWNVATQQFITYTRSGGVWPTINNSDATKGPFIGVNEGFFYNNASTTATWVYNYTVP